MQVFGYKVPIFPAGFTLKSTCGVVKTLPILSITTFATSIRWVQAWMLLLFTWLGLPCGFMMFETDCFVFVGNFYRTLLPHITVLTRYVNPLVTQLVYLGVQLAHATFPPHSSGYPTFHLPGRDCSSFYWGFTKQFTRKPWSCIPNKNFIIFFWLRNVHFIA